MLDERNGAIDNELNKEADNVQISVVMVDRIAF